MVHTETDMAHALIGCYSQIDILGQIKYGSFYPKSCVEIRDSVFDGQINDLN